MVGGEQAPLVLTHMSVGAGKKAATQTRSWTLILEGSEISNLLSDQSGCERSVWEVRRSGQDLESGQATILSASMVFDRPVPGTHPCPIFEQTEGGGRMEPKRVCSTRTFQEARTLLTHRVQVPPFRMVLEVSSYLRMVVAGGSGRTSEERMVLDP